MKIVGNQEVEIEVSKKELAKVIKQIIIEEYMGLDFEDSGYKWLTKGSNVYLDDKNNSLIATDSEVASLVDTMNILKYGFKLKAEED